MPDRQSVVGTACLGLVTAAGERALGFIELSTVDGGTTEADAVVLETGVTETVACERIIC